MAKYKVGDKVMVRKNFAGENCEGFVCPREMSIFGGKIVTIKDIGNGKDIYTIQGDNHLFNWTEEMFEPITSEKSNVNRNYLPDDVKQVIIHDKTVIVILKNGGKGVSTCSPGDEFDEYIGYSVALQRARDGYAFQIKCVLASCIESAKKKGYKHAILKND